MSDLNHPAKILRRRVDIIKEIQRSLKRSLNMSDGSVSCVDDRNVLAEHIQDSLENW